MDDRETRRGQDRNHDGYIERAIGRGPREHRVSASVEASSGMIACLPGLSLLVPAADGQVDGWHEEYGGHHRTARPPIIARASSAYRSLPASRPSAIEIIPRSVASEVIRIGRRRFLQDCTTASEDG